MEPSKSKPASAEFNRREFIQNAASFGALMALMGGVPLHAEEKPPEGAPTKYSTVSAPVNCAVIGCGPWGREILQTLSRLPNAPVVAVCDTYESALRRGKEGAPAAEGFTDYQKVLDKKEVQAVIVATPPHLHREIVVAALAAGKHVYCEAPLAVSVEDARAIAQAAKASPKVNFQAGLQTRSDPQRHFLIPFIRSGAAGKNIMARAQWNKKECWRRPAANPEREKAINWRLSSATSAGLVGEVGIHQLDMVNWLFDRRPLAVSGSGGVLNWKDGRDVADTIHAVYEYADGVNFFQSCTLANSFDGGYEVLYGTDSAVMMRGSKAWLFKEVDSPLLGWEVYARKEQFHQETGIALVANASKLPPAPKPGEAPPAEITPLQHALAAFVTNSGVVGKGVEDFTANYGDDVDSLREYIAGLAKSRRPAAGYIEGLEATIIALKTNEAIVKGQRIVLAKEWFEV
ncbi:MAG: Gfo/Idh/MocA family oxidoreductase [Verrucomicrobiota bacterium]